MLSGEGRKASTTKAYDELMSMFNESGSGGQGGSASGGGGGRNSDGEAVAVGSSALPSGLSRAQMNIEKLRQLQASAAMRANRNGPSVSSGIEAELMATKARISSRNGNARSASASTGNLSGSAAGQAAYAMQMARANRARATVSNGSGGAPNGSSRSGANGAGRGLTKEQVIVGHYCRHATKMLERLMAGKPDGPAKEQELKARIKTYWSFWIHGRMTKQDFLNRVDRFVNTSCPEAAGISVNGAFRTWYQAQAAQTQQRRLQQHQMAHRAKQQELLRLQQQLKADPAAGAQLQQQLQRQRLAEERQRQLLRREREKMQNITGSPSDVQKTNTGQDADDGDDDKVLVPPGTTLARKKKPPPARLPLNTTNDSSSLAGTKHSLPEGAELSQNKKMRIATKPPKRPNVSAGQAAAVGVKAARRGEGGKPSGPRQHHVDDELNFVKNIVDIEQEEEALVGRGAQPTSIPQYVDTNRYAESMLLNGPRLRKKLERLTRKHDLEGVSMEVIEFVSLAARERLSAVIESLRETAQARRDAGRREWTTCETGPDMKKKWLSMRKDEQRALDVEKELRKRKRKVEEEKQAAKLASENAADGKTSKEIAAAAEAARKEKVELEKKKQAASSTEQALAALTAGLTRRKKRAKAKAAQKAAASSFPSWTRSQDSSAGTSGKSSLKTTGTSMNDIASRVKAVGASKEVASSSTKRMDGVTRPGDYPLIEDTTPITLRDCIFFMQHEHNSRTSHLLFKWMPRMSYNDPAYDNHQ